MIFIDDFAAFFEEVNGYPPFPWQSRLIRQISESGRWPNTLDLPTGAGKTATIDIAVFHLALEADRGEARGAPVRIAFVVDRRLVVDDAFTRARQLTKALSDPSGPVSAKVSKRLCLLAGDGPPLLARRLRGGLPREEDWARTPSQPTVLCSTVDQIGSRLLFRGYGVSDSMKPVHAGLIGSDCRILLDEAHLAEPFRQTLEWIGLYHGESWHDVGAVGTWAVTLLTATPGDTRGETFSIDDDDRNHTVLAARLGADKPARLIASARKTKKVPHGGHEDEDEVTADGDVLIRANAIVQEVRHALDYFADPSNGAVSPAIGVVTNRVARARCIHQILREEFESEIESGAVAEPILMIGPARPADREDVVTALGPIRTRTWKLSEQRTLERSILLISTQCIEAGVDIDLDGLITEAAPLDSLRQRFGRLNRAGRRIRPYAAVIAGRSDLAARYEDPVYGTATRFAWEYLIAASDETDNRVPIVNFGIDHFDARLRASPPPLEAYTEKVESPVLLPAYVDLFSQTSPVPACSPDTALFLHGARREPDSVTVVWRADIDPTIQAHNDVRRLMTLVPPRSAESIELPRWAVQRWLTEVRAVEDPLADIAAASPDGKEHLGTRSRIRPVFRWKGDVDESRWITPEEIRSGDTIVAPVAYGGVDQFGWSPNERTAATDIGRRAAKPFVGRSYAVRVAPGLLSDLVSQEALADSLAGALSRGWKDMRQALLELSLDDEMREDLVALDSAPRGEVIVYDDLYGTDDQDRPRGIVFLAHRGIKTNRGVHATGTWSSTEDDLVGSAAGFPLSLEVHSRDVERTARSFASSCGLSPARVRDLAVAGYLHDIGKSDPRFQAWLHHGDPFGIDPERSEAILAKSARTLPRGARAAAGLPEHWRHEALSVRMARTSVRLGEADDPALVLWLVGSHHGYGRPLFPHCDPTELQPDLGPQSLAFEWSGCDWPALFQELKNRYGPWNLARMEAILRLADHRASEARAVEEIQK